MDNTYVNLNTVTLYKTPKFNKIDSVIFSSILNRDNYFNSIPDTNKIVITDFTDLYEGRSIILPYNYTELKEYNTMKLYYNDGLGHDETYYCNVDNYLYISTDACYPVYRIDYFMTFGYMLYNKDLDIVTDRRTVVEEDINKNMKADDVGVPRYHYEKYNTWYIAPSDTNKAPYYIVYLNKTQNNNGKLGINCKMQFYLGVDSNSVPYKYDIDTYTIGCYVAIADKDHLATILSNEPLEYIEKIIEVDSYLHYLHTTDQSNLVSNGYVYLEHDIELGITNDSYYMTKVNLINDFGKDNRNLIDNAYIKHSDRVNLYPNHKKKILDWQPTKGIVIQGFEFDIKDFDDRDFPSVTGIDTYYYLYSTIYFFNFLGYTFAYPLGYKHEAVNYDFMIKWQSGRNFSYSSDYTNSLAYKELQEYNNQAVKFAKQQAGVQSYYNNQLLEKTKTALDITKQQTLLSYQNQANSLNTSIANLQEQHKSLAGGTSDFLNIVSGYASGGVLGGTGNLAGMFVNKQTTENNIQLLRDQANILFKQTYYDVKSLNNQYQQAVLNTQYQNDCLAIVRDNTIANIAISNKYNNAKPNAYYETDFTQYSSYYYMFYIDLTDGDQIEQNIKNRYNVLGTYLGYLETLNISQLKGLYFNYIKGSIIDNSNSVSSGIPNDIYIELITRIEEGVRLWKPNQLVWFGDLLKDNTNLGLPEVYDSTLSEEAKIDMFERMEDYMYVYYYDKNVTKSTLQTNFVGHNDYVNYLVDSQPWGDSTISADRQTELYTYRLYLSYDYNNTEQIEIIKNADFLTVYEKQYTLQLW